MDQELLTYLDRRFAAIDQRFEHIDQRFEQIDQRFEQMDRRFEAIDQRFERLEEEMRHLHILVEGLRGEGRLVAEAMFGFSEQLGRHTVEVDRKLTEFKDAVHPAYKDLEHYLDIQVTEVKGRLLFLEERADRDTRDIMDVLREKYGLRDTV